MQDRADRLALAYDVLLPIWERWTDGSPTLRRFLECRGAEPSSQVERLHLLLETTRELRRLGLGSPGVGAALLAAAACLKAYLGVAEQQWQEAVQRTLVAAQGIADVRGHS